MAAIERRHSKEEFARRGDAIYDNEIRPMLKSADEGKFVAIDIESGMYQLDVDELQACHKLRARIPDAQIWMVRVGYRSVHRFGGRDQRETRFNGSKPPGAPARVAARPWALPSPPA